MSLLTAERNAAATAKRLEGKTALVTGAGSGIGRAAALKLAEEGANIVLVDLKENNAGQVAFAKMAALELAQYKIRVNVICPGAIETNISQNTQKTDAVNEITIPIKYPKGNQPLEHKAGSPEQVADLVLFLASNESSHITGSEIFIDGAESLL